MRTLEKCDAPSFSGMQIFNNYVRLHEALEGLDSRGSCGIEIQGEKRVVNNNSKCEP